MVEEHAFQETIVAEVSVEAEGRLIVSVDAAVQEVVEARLGVTAEQEAEKEAEVETKAGAGVRTKARYSPSGSCKSKRRAGVKVRAKTKTKVEAIRDSTLVWLRQQSVKDGLGMVLPMAAACANILAPAKQAASVLTFFTIGWWCNRLMAGGEARVKLQEMVQRSKDMADMEEEADAFIEAWNGRTFPIAQCDTALVLVDLQADAFRADGRLSTPCSDTERKHLLRALENAERLLLAARAAGLTVAHSRSQRCGSQVRMDLGGPLDEAYELCSNVRARPGEVVVDKWTFGAFGSTDLEIELRSRGVRRILLAGVLTNSSVLATAMQAAERFFRVCLVEDACASYNHEWHRRAVTLIHEPQSQADPNSAGLYFGEVAFVDDVEDALKGLR